MRGDDHNDKNSEKERDNDDNDDDDDCKNDGPDDADAWHAPLIPQGAQGEQRASTAPLTCVQEPGVAGVTFRRQRLVQSDY